ncbi:MAG TPA: carbohydrate porin [Hanamia sp.]
MACIIFPVVALILCQSTYAQSNNNADTVQEYFHPANQTALSSSADNRPSIFLDSKLPKQQKDTSENRSNFLRKLKDNGVVFGVAESLEGYYNFTGGIRVGSAAASTFDLNVGLDLNKLLHLRGAKFYADFEAHSFQNPTKLLVEDIQVFDKNTADPFLQMFEFWYQQEFFHNTLRLKIGKVDANAEFSLIDNGLNFMSSSSHVTPTLFVFPTFPDPKPSVNLFFTPGKLFYTSIAAYAANQSNHFLDFSGKPGSVQPTLNGTLWITESGLTWSHLSGKAADGNLRLGIWTHTGEFNRTEDSSAVHGASGMYAVINQTIWKPVSETETNRGLRMFVEYARSDKGVAPVYQQFGGGLLWTGIAEGRRDDVLGISTQYARISLKPGLLWKHEQTIESFYKFILASWVNLQPDLQYIVHPGGFYNNALVGTLELNLQF